MKDNNRNIKYQLWIDGYLDELKRHVVFLFCMPKIYGTYEDATKENGRFFVCPRELDTEEVVFDVYMRDDGENNENFNLVDTIRWKDFHKYECQIISEKGISQTLAEVEPDLVATLGNFANLPCLTEDDLEPYADRFEIMYQKYLDTAYTLDDICGKTVQCTSYVVKPIIVE